MNGQYLILTEHPFVWNAVTNTEDSIEPHPLAPIQRTFNGKQDGWCDRPFKACDQGCTGSLIRSRKRSWWPLRMPAWNRAHV